MQSPACRHLFVVIASACAASAAGGIAVAAQVFAVEGERAELAAFVAGGLWIKLNRLTHGVRLVRTMAGAKRAVDGDRSVGATP